MGVRSNVRWLVPLAAIWIFAVAAASAAPAQQPGAATGQDPNLTATANLVIVPTLVRDAAGQLVYGLKVDDFALSDDGVPQKLRLEEDTGGEPLALAVVIESGAAMREAGWHPDRPAHKTDRFRGLPAMVESIAGGVPHQVAVIGFDSRPELELRLTSNAGGVAEIIDELDQGNTGDGGAAILDALILAVEQLRAAPIGYRRAILLLSETEDRGSTHTLDEALRAISETNTAIYSLAFGTGRTKASEYGNKMLPTKHIANSVPEPGLGPQGSPVTSDDIIARLLQTALFGFALGNPTPYPPGGCMGKDPAAPAQNKLVQLYDCLGQLAPPLALAKMAAIAATNGIKKNVPESVARLTGGEYLPFNTAKTLQDGLATFANHVPNRYILTFQPQNPHPGLHVLELQLKEYPQLRITARTSYWANPAASTP
jgi:VWFA-related protein